MEFENFSSVKANRAVYTDILHFGVRVLAKQAVSGDQRAAAFVPDTVLPVYSCDVTSPFSRLRLQTASGLPVVGTTVNTLRLCSRVD